jgi:exopolysaccharide biosynthesis WecB/TagA/CpsF family protein
MPDIVTMSASHSSNQPSGAVDGTQPSPDSELMSVGASTLPPSLVEVDGQAVNVFDLAHAVELVTQMSARRHSFLVCTLNLDHLMKLRRDPEFRRAYARAALVTADGFPIVTLSRIRGCQLQRAAGSDFIEPLCAAAAQNDLPIFLVGSTFSVLSATARRLIASFPGLEIAGVYAPSSGFSILSPSADEALTLIRESGARLCFIALGAPLQEAFALRALDETAGVAFLPIGAGLDFLAGAQVRAPLLLQKMNLEWAWRLIKDPKRLWLRYVQCGFLFAELLLKEMWDAIVRRLASRGRL